MKSVQEVSRTSFEALSAALESAFERGEARRPANGVGLATSCAAKEERECARSGAQRPQHFAQGGPALKSRAF